MLIIRPSKDKVVCYHRITYSLRIILRIDSIAKLLQNISQSACLGI